MVDNIYEHNPLNYSFNGMMNFAHETKLVEWQPVGTFTTGMGQNDVCTFQISSDDFLNPYGLYLELVIDLSQNTKLADDSTYKNKILQIDSSASSFIDSMIVQLRDENIETIYHYDILAALLKDMRQDQRSRDALDFEGNGGISTPSLPNTYLTSWGIPQANDGVRKPMSGYFPSYDNSTFVDTNTRTQQSNTNNYTTINMANASTMYSFTPQGLTNATFSGGTDINETDNNYADNSRTGGTSGTRSVPANNGLYQPFNPLFASTGFEPWFSQTVPQRYLKSGFIKADTPQQLVFQIPVLSSFFGHLLPPNLWKLIPMRYFDKLQFQFTFSPHALFSSWWGTDQSVRNYVIKKCVMKSEMIKITNQTMLQQVENEYTQNGIRLASQAFFYGPNYNIINGAVPSNLYVNLGFASLKNVLIMFTPNDYLQNSSFRKHYRLSMAITSLQLMLGTDYFPQQPIVGNGGTNMGLVNNNDFLRNFYKCFGKHIGTVPGIINGSNFAVNCRESDPTSTDVNLTSNVGIGYFLENRVIGKCCYGIPLDPMNYEGKMFSGRDTTKKTPFLINFTYDNTKVFTRSTTLHTWFHHDYVLIVKPDSITTVGRN